MPEGVHQRFPGGEWLDPVADGLSRAATIVDSLKVVLLTVMGGVVLLYVGAKVEREVMKRRLSVVAEPAPEQQERVSGDRR